MIPTWLTISLNIATALGVLLTGIGTVRNRRSLKEVHSMVNAQLTAAVERRDVSETENVQLRQDAKNATTPDPPAPPLPGPPNTTH